MIPVTYIQRNAKTLTTCFNKSIKSKKTLMMILYAKLIIIEIGGWVEMSMDDIVERAGKDLKMTNNISHLKTDVIKRNYGFDYAGNFRPMLMKAIGIVKLEALEQRLDISKFTKMKAALALLKDARNAVAHTYVKNPTRGITFAAPSLAMSYFRDIYDGLKDIEVHMKALKLI